MPVFSPAIKRPFKQTILKGNRFIMNIMLQKLTLKPVYLKLIGHIQFYAHENKNINLGRLIAISFIHRYTENRVARKLMLQGEK